MKSFKETLKEGILPDNWLKELMRDVKNGEGWCTIDYIQSSAEQELNKDVWKNDKEIADQVKKLGFGNLLRESKKRTLTESKKYRWNSIDFENVPGGLEVSDLRDGVGIHMYSGGSGYGNKGGDRWVNGDDSYETNRDPIIEKMIRDLLPVCDRFDKEVEAVMKKHGFSKK